MENIKIKKKGRIEDLKLSVLKMKQQHDNLQKRLKEEYDQKAKLERVMQRVNQLEQRNLQQQKILKRKNEEIAQAQRKLRGAALPRINIGNQVSIDEKKRCLDLEIEKILDQCQRLDELQKELKKKEDIIAKKEAMLAENSELEIKKLRSSQILNRNFMGLSEKLVSVEEVIETKKQEIVQVAHDQEQNIKDEIEKLKQVREKVKKQLTGLGEKLKDGTLLSNQEERRLIELEEAVDELDAAIEYKNKVIESRQMELRLYWLMTQNDNEILNLFNTLNHGEMWSLLSRYFERVINLRDAERKMAHKINEFEAKIEDKDILLYEAQTSQQREAIDTDRKLIQQQQQYEQKIGMLMHKLAQAGHSGTEGYNQSEVNAKIHHLEKELYYYKKTSRDLKRKLHDKESSSLSQSEDIFDQKLAMSKDVPRFKSSSTSSQPTLPRTSKNNKTEKDESDTEHLFVKSCNSIRLLDSLEAESSS